jgi:iron only hydrogenase large subunit-like protein
LLLLQEGQDGLKLNVRASSKRQESELAPAEPNKKSGFQQTIVDDDTQAVKVSLNDCLACSGCVTSAETVLLQHQSLKEFVAKCGDPDTIVVVSVSPQSRASLAGESSSRRLQAVAWVRGSLLAVAALYTSHAVAVNNVAVGLLTVVPWPTLKAMPLLLSCLLA